MPFRGISRSRTVLQGTLANQAWYGIERDETIASADWTRIASSAAAMDLHRTLPIQSSIKGCLLNANKTVNYYLKSDDWSKKQDGTVSNRTGTDGNVMARRTKDCYWKYEKEGNAVRIKISEYPLVGFTKSEKCNYSAYEGVVVGGKLSSVAGVLPASYTSETNFRTYARANGAGYEQQVYHEYKELLWLWMIEYATNHFQKPVNPVLTAQGYRQGGLGNGVTTAISTEWSAFNAYKPFITCGSSDALANGSGEVPVVIANFGGAGINRTFNVPRYRGIENLFGHIWKWVDGISINHLATTREVWIFDDPALIADNTSVNARYVGLLAPASGYGKTMIFDSKGCLLPATVGGGTTTYMCDYFYTPAFGSGWRALISGGTADVGAFAGPLSAHTHHGASYTSNFGARLFAR